MGFYANNQSSFYNNNNVQNQEAYRFATTPIRNYNINPEYIVNNLNFNHRDLLIPPEIYADSRLCQTIAAYLINEIQSHVTKNPPRTFGFNLLSDNGYNNDYFISFLSIVYVNIFIYSMERNSKFIDSARLLIPDMVTWYISVLWLVTGSENEQRDRNYAIGFNQNEVDYIRNEARKRMRYKEAYDYYCDRMQNSNMNNGYGMNNQHQYTNNRQGFQYNNFHQYQGNSSYPYQQSRYTNNNSFASTNNYWQQRQERMPIGGRFTHHNSTYNTSNFSNNIKSSDEDMEKSFYNHGEFQPTMNKEEEEVSINIVTDEESEDSLLVNEALDPDFYNKWHPSESQPAWKTYDFTENKCIIVNDEKGNPIQTFTKRNLNMEEKKHLIESWHKPGQDPDLHPTTKTDGLEVLDKAINNLSFSDEKLDDLTIKREENKEPVDDIPLINNDVITHDSLDSIMFSVDGESRKIKFKTDRKLINFNLCVINPIITENNQCQYVDNIVKAENIKEVRDILIRDKDKMDIKLWTFLESRLTTLVNDTLKWRLLFNVRIDSFVDDLPEILTFIESKKLIIEFNKELKNFISKLFIKMTDPAHFNCLREYIVDDEKSDEDKSIKEIKSSDLMNIGLTIAPERINLTQIDELEENIVLASNQNAINMIDGELNPKLYNLVNWIFTTKNDYAKYYIRGASGKIFEIFKTTLNNKSFTIKALD